MKTGQRVIVAKPVPWTTSDEAVAPQPTVGLKGKIADPAKYPYPTPPAGKSAVQFKSTDLGFEPWDDDHKYTILYVQTDCLRAL